MKFVDECKIHIKAGNGGNGCVSFFRGPNLPNGGPDGGDGGRGGSVYFVADPNLHSLLDFKYQRNYEAERGKGGGSKNCNGRSGKDLLIRVPLGTLVKTESDEVWDLTEAQKPVLIARGGKGGRGNHSFKSSTLQAPRIFTPGTEGEEKSLHLELKSLCHVGLVGFPNAGKSSLLTALSAARPKVADYPFTTLSPQLGVAENQIKIADIPGLIKGAHINQGLGHRFLKHISRAQILVFVLALDEESELEECLTTLQDELRLYDPSLLEKRSLIVVNKSDLLEGSEILRDDWRRFQSKYPESLLISALHQTGLKELQFRLESALSDSESQELCYTGTT